MENATAPHANRRRLNPSPETLFIDTPTGTPIAASPGSPGRRGPPQEPTPQPAISAAPAFAAPLGPPGRRPPRQKSSPQPQISATTVAAAAAAASSPGPPDFQPPRRPIPQTPTAASNPVTLLIKDWSDCQRLFSPGSAKMVAIISNKFSLRDLPLLERLIKNELQKPRELQGFVIGNPEIIPELRKKREMHVAMLREGPKGHEPSRQPPISVVPPDLCGAPQAPRPQTVISALPAAFPATSFEPPKDLLQLCPTPSSDLPIVLINDQEDCRALATHGYVKVLAIISPKFALDQLPLLEATIATESNKPPEFQSFVVTNPEIIPELRKRLAFLLQTARTLDLKLIACGRLIRRMLDLKATITSVGRISLEGIDRQIDIMARSGLQLRQKRMELQREYRI